MSAHKRTSYRAKLAATTRPPAIGAMMFAITAIMPAAAFAADIKVGVAGPMSGPLQEAGAQIMAGATAAAKAVSADGGLAVRIVKADDRATATGAIAAARRLVAAKVLAVAGHYNSTAAISASEIYAENNILLFAPAAIVPKLTDRKLWNVFRLAPREDRQGRLAGNILAREYAARPVAVIAEANAFGRGIARTARDAYSAVAGGKAPAITAEIESGTPKNARAIDALAVRLKKANVAAIFWSGGAANGGRLLKAVRARGHAAAFLGTEALASPQFLGVIRRLGTPDIAEGVRMTLAGPVGPPPARPSASGDEPELPASRPALGAHAAIEILAAAIKATGGTNPRAIAKWLHAGNRVQTVLGPVSFDAIGDRRETLYRMYVWKKAADGKLIFVPE